MNAIELTLDQLLAAGALLDNPKGPLSLWKAEKAPGTRRLSHPELVSSAGGLLPEIRPALTTLADPAFLTRITLLSGERLMDTVIYQPQDPLELPVVRLDEREGSLSLVSPADLPDLLLDMLTLIAPSSEDAQPWECDVTLNEALVLWAALDGLRDGQETLPDAAVLAVHISQPMETLANLAAYAREMLNLIAPSKREVGHAIAGLAQRGLLSDDGTHVKPALAGVAADLFPLTGHLRVESKAAPDGEVLESRVAFLQGPEGAGLLWYEIHGEVHFQRISTAAALAVVEMTLFEPWTMFAPA
ncbi:MAG: hypothetical protein EPO32_09645 [Anaerolineae bacterium]|nr:MAG: hypothetical protein EPO32_09645 [Anaerolineae bacterium]